MKKKLKPGELLPSEEMRDVRLEHVTLYEVITNEDLCGGRGRSVSLGWYLHRFDAIERARGAGVFGSDAEVKSSEQWVMRYRACSPNGSREVIHIIGTEVSVTYVDPKVSRTRALAKLTPEEREVLGLKDE